MKPLRNTNRPGSQQPNRKLSTARKAAGLILVAVSGALLTATVVGQSYDHLTAEKAASLYAAPEAAPTPAAEPMLAAAPEVIELGQEVKAPDAHFRVGPPVIYQSFTPCRVIDTRLANGTHGGPKLVGGATRTFTGIAPFGGLCGSTLPEGVTAIAANVTLVNTDSQGFITIFPAGTTRPLAATVNARGANEVVNNGVIVPLNASGAIDVYANMGTHMVIDVVGYFFNQLEEGDRLSITGTNANASPLLGVNNATAPGSHGVGGFTGSGATVYGVQGQVGSGTTTGSAGVRGLSPGCCTGNPPVNSGVLGNAGSGATVGVVGIGDFEGVRGINTAGLTNTVASFGALGYTDTIAVYASGNTVATGTKSFVEPHPTRPDKVIRFVSLEGPEAGTYFRGRGKFKGKQAIIEVPETFRMVTEEENLSVQVTPIGKMAQVAVVKIGLDKILVKSSEDVEFFYTVNGERRGFAGFETVANSAGEFAPRTPNAEMPTALSEHQKRTLIATGVYNADGTPNIATAQRMGWDKNWNKDEEQRALARQVDPSAPTFAGGAEIFAGQSANSPR
jgi:hypothetical protein